MKEKLIDLLRQAAQEAHRNGALPCGDFPDIDIERPKAESHGDFSTNLAMLMAKTQKMPPRKVAEILVAHLPAGESLIERTEIAGPGFINFFIQPSAWYPILAHILTAGPRFGRNDIGSGARVQVEFVSANPTGPLHVGHGRGAAVGDAMASILEWCGYEVQREYYINDSGRQIATLGRSVWLRYRQARGETVDFPGDLYQGDYIRDLAAEVRDRHGAELESMDEAAAVSLCARYAADAIMAGIREDLDAFGVHMDHWFSEQSLYDNGKVTETLDALKARDLIYENEGAQWFRTTTWADEKDRVVVRANGQTTYFAPDIAYHRDKYERGFDRVIDVWGADHHGYIPRMRAAIGALGREQRQFDVILVQLVNLLRDGQPVAMSSRAGEFVTLKEVVDEVGRDAARFIFLTRSHDSKLDFDLELAKRKTNDNPVYYVQYVHARISSILAKAEERGLTETQLGQADLTRLGGEDDIRLIQAMTRFPEVVASAGRLMEPHRVPYYLTELASAFHAYYNRQKVLTEDEPVSLARLYLVLAVRRVIANGLALLGVSAPEHM